MKTTPLQPSVFSRASDTLGECPVWDAAGDRLLWVDWLEQRLHIRGREGGETRSIELGEHVGSFALCRSGPLLLARRKDLALLDLESGAIESHLAVPVAGDERCLNDGKCDSRGRFWFGSISDSSQGHLFRYDPASGEISSWASGIKTSNGLGWSPDDRTFYYADSGNRRLWAYDFDAESGSIDNQRLLHDFNKWPAGNPDGLSVDSQGDLWIALWDGGCLVRMAPDGEVKARLAFPIPRFTSCAFGGPDLEELYITTAAIDAPPPDGDQTAVPGNLLQIAAPAPGLPVHPCAL